MYRPVRGGRSCEHFGGYTTINRIPLPYKYNPIPFVACVIGIVIEVERVFDEWACLE